MLAEAQGQVAGHTGLAIEITIAKPPPAQPTNGLTEHAGHLVPPLFPRHLARRRLTTRPPRNIALVHDVTPHGGSARQRRAHALGRRDTHGAY